jgi:CDP-glycerol glycerophosphotransferase (TagB/SpsB family)
MKTKRVFVSADHGLSIVYFLQSDVVPTLLERGVEVVLLTDDALRGKIHERFNMPGLSIEGLKLSEAKTFQNQSRDAQWWLAFLRRVGGSNRIRTAAMDSYVQQVWVEEPPRRLLLMPLAWAAIWMLRRSPRLRRELVRLQERYADGIYDDLLERYSPDLVISSTPGWRLDRYLLREAGRRHLPTASVVVGWDNPSSYSIPGASVAHMTCWSDLQKEELVLGSDWRPENVNVGGIPSYDGYFNRRWLVPREEYFMLHNLDPERKLLSYACSFVSFSPNWQNIEALARLVHTDSLAAPCQLLIRLHPNHFWDVDLFIEERERIRRLARDMPHVHVVDPVPLGGELGYYSGEDMPEKASMLAHSDVFLTVYSTMVVEAAIHDTPIVSVCIDAPGGWNRRRKYSLALSRIGDWPTHARFRDAHAGHVVHSESELRQAINGYLSDPSSQADARRQFVRQEITFTDGSAGRRTADYLLSLLPEAGS